VKHTPVQRRKLLAIRILSPAALLVAGAALLVPSSGANAQSSNAASVVGAGTLPDGKYENVTIEGRVVPMIHVMNGGAVVLVDTDGKKPRTWEEQWKRKGNLPGGTYDLHKTDVNGNGTFADDPIDREGRWTIAAVAAAGQPPPDGKYANVIVEGRRVPMIHVMNGGAVVLVDTDGKKPRTWEEQWKRKGDVPSGTYDVHKTDVNGNGTFADDPIDRRGTWTIDDKGNVTVR
jgi:hypothetical protein